MIFFCFILPLIQNKDYLDIGPLLDTNWLDYKEALPHAIFLLPVISSFVLSFLGYFNPVQRWRQLRLSACMLESHVWLYRCRIDQFSPVIGKPKASEDALMTSLSRVFV